MLAAWRAPRLANLSATEFCCLTLQSSWRSWASTSTCSLRNRSRFAGRLPSDVSLLPEQCQEEQYVRTTVQYHEVSRKTANLPRGQPLHHPFHPILRVCGVDDHRFLIMPVISPLSRCFSYAEAHCFMIRLHLQALPSSIEFSTLTRPSASRIQHIIHRNRHLILFSPCLPKRDSNPRHHTIRFILTVRPSVWTSG
ncbi:hypothetical protein BS17DRAFT_84785 [Gyrodon lividus]|nr:hypothetical protein BS17DRAFT_84785 [Gyrodon lividus]